MVRLPFSMEEYEQRLARVRLEMKSRRLDGIILTKPDNIYYLSGYGASTLATSIDPLHVLLVPSSGPPRILTRRVEEAAVAETQWTPDPRLHADDENAFSILADLIDEVDGSAGAWGLEYGFLSVQQMERMKHALPRTQFHGADGLVESVRVVPSAAELVYIRKAAAVAQAGLTRALDCIRPDVPVYRIVGEIHHAMYGEGQADLFAGSQVGRRTPWVGVWAGRNGGCVHDTSAVKQIEKGDLVTVELWGSHAHYTASAMATVYVGGRPPAEWVETYEMLSGMYVAARDAIAAGVPAEVPYHAANAIYRARKGVDYFRTFGFAGGLGTGDVRLFKGQTQPIPEGMSFRVQSGLFFEPLMVVCASVLATHDGREELSTPQLELISK